MNLVQFRNARTVWAHISKPGNERATVREIVQATGVCIYSAQIALTHLKRLGYIRHTGKLCRDRVVIVRLIEARYV